MRSIPYHHLEKGKLSPLELFMYEKYKNHIDVLESPSDFPLAMKELAAKYPEIGDMFCEFCKNVEGSTDCSEERYMSKELDLSVYSNLRYFPKATHTHRFFEIIVVLVGQCENIVEDTKLTLKAGDVCFLAPEVPHCILVNNDEVISYNIIIRTSTFRNTFARIYVSQDIVSDFFTQNLYRYKSGTSPYILCRTDREQIFEELLYRMIDEEQNPKKFSKRYMNILFESFILELIRRHEYHFTIGEATDNVEHESITGILRYIQGNYRDLTLSETAKYFHYSEAYLSRMIKNFTGQSFSSIIKTIKIQKAARLLLETNMSVLDIVDEIGYSDSSHFYKVFKQHFGMTPVQFKEKSPAEEEHS